MAWTSAELSRGVPQKVHGPRPSFIQMTFPHDMQFGAAVWRGCLVATQLHFLALGLSSVGFVEISRERMAASRSARAVDCPAMGVPPAMEILVVVLDGFGVDVRDGGVDFAFALDEGPSEIK
jgi:hypothetical protein